MIALTLALAPCAKSLAAVFGAAGKADAASVDTTAMTATASDPTGNESDDETPVCNKTCDCQKAVMAGAAMVKPRTGKVLAVPVALFHSQHMTLKALAPPATMRRPPLVGITPSFKAALARTGRLLI